MGFVLLAGDDASEQPPDIPDLLLHETVVAWIRNFLRKHPFLRSGTLDVQEGRLRSLLQKCEDHINSNYDVDGLCHRFSTRLQQMINKDGERLKN